MTAPTTMQIAAAAIFAAALIHTLSAQAFHRLAERNGPHAGLWHLFGEIEVVFGLWALVLVIVMALLQGAGDSIDYLESRHFTEPVFVFVVMVVAASRPVLVLARTLVGALARSVPVSRELAEIWLALAFVPLLGSLITEPAAMTLAALMLARRLFDPALPVRLRYAALGVLFVNISVGGLLTSYAAPPVLMVAARWGWDTAFMAETFGWRVALAVVVNASALCVYARRAIAAAAPRAASADSAPGVPPVVSLVHLVFLALLVMAAHHVVLLVALFLFFLGYVQAYARYQDALILRQSLLVAFFLAGLVVLGGQQQWWLQPIVSGLEPTWLFFGAAGLTAITDNAALTYLGSLIDGIAPAAQYMLVAGAVTGGGLTVIANAPNPAGAALLKGGFEGGAIAPARLLLGALPPTAVAAACLLL